MTTESVLILLISINHVTLDDKYLVCIYDQSITIMHVSLLSTFVIGESTMKFNVTFYVCHNFELQLKQNIFE